MVFSTHSRCWSNKNSREKSATVNGPLGSFPRINNCIVRISETRHPRRASSRRASVISEARTAEITRLDNDRPIPKRTRYRNYDRCVTRDAMLYPYVATRDGFPLGLTINCPRYFRKETSFSLACRRWKTFQSYSSFYPQFVIQCKISTIHSYFPINILSVFYQYPSYVNLCFVRVVSFKLQTVNNNSACKQLFWILKSWDCSSRVNSRKPWQPFLTFNRSV